MSVEVSTEFSDWDDPIMSFHERLQHWHGIFDNSSLEGVKHYGGKPLAELNSLWHEAGMMGRAFVFKGVGIRRNIELFQDEDGDIQVSSEFETGEIWDEIGISHGLQVMVNGATNKPHLMYKVELPTRRVAPDDTLDIDYTPKAFIEVSSAELIPIDEIEPEYVIRYSSDYEDPQDILRDGAKRFDRFMRRDGFKRLPNTKKGRKIDNFLTRLEEDAGIRDASVAFGASRIVQSVVSTESGEMSYNVVDLPKAKQREVYGGEVVGLSMLFREMVNNLPPQVSLTRPRRTGYLALTVQIQYGDKEIPELAAGSIVHVPLSGQSVGFQFE